MSEPICSRESLSPDQIYDLYYIGSGLDRVLVIELLNHVGQELRIPTEKIRPEDRFSIELAPKKGNEWDSGYGILLYELKRQATKRKKAISKPIDTVDDYLKAMSEVY